MKCFKGLLAFALVFGVGMNGLTTTAEAAASGHAKNRKLKLITRSITTPAVGSVLQAMHDGTSPDRHHVEAAKRTVAKFVAELQANGEVESFDRQVMQAAQQDRPDLVSELEQRGGAFAVLRDSDAEFDRTFAKVDSKGSKIAKLFNILTGTKEAQALPMCSLFFWTFTLGYGEGLNYYYCLR